MAGTGIDPTGATDSTTAIQAKLDSLSSGGFAYFPAGRFKVTGLTVSKPTTIIGAGGMFTATNQGGTFPGSAATTLIVNSTTATALSLTSPGCTIEDLAVVNVSSSDATAGYGIDMSAAHNFRLSRVTVQNFWINVHAQGRFGTIDSCNILDPVHYGIFFTGATGQEDFGDQGVSNSVIALYGRTTNPVAAVRWESGGGIRWASNKIVAGTGPGATGIGSWQYGIDITAVPGVITVEWEIIGGAISTCTTACLRITQQDTGQFSSATVRGVVFQGAGTGARGIVIGAVDSNHSNSIRNISIDGCDFKGVLGGPIAVNNSHGVHIGTNTYDDAAYLDALVHLGGGADDGIGTIGVSVAKQNLGGMAGVDVIRDERRLGSVASLSGSVDHGFTRNFYANSVGTWVTLGYFDLPTTDGGTGSLEVELTGYDYGVGPMYARYRRLLTKAEGSNTVTVTTDGTDVTAGAGSHYAVQFVTTTANRVIVQYQLTTGSLTIWGQAKVTPSGHFALSHAGA
jgi:hypothetical protein